MVVVQRKNLKLKVKRIVCWFLNRDCDSSRPAWNPGHTGNSAACAHARLHVRHNSRFPPWLLCFQHGCENPTIKSPRTTESWSNLPPAAPFSCHSQWEDAWKILNLELLLFIFFVFVLIVPEPGPNYPLHWHLHSCLSFSPVPSPPAGPWDVWWRRSVKQKVTCEVPTPSPRPFDCDD